MCFTFMMLWWEERSFDSTIVVQPPCLFLESVTFSQVLPSVVWWVKKLFFHEATFQTSFNVWWDSFCSALLATALLNPCAASKRQFRNLKRWTMSFSQTALIMLSMQESFLLTWLCQQWCMVHWQDSKCFFCFIKRSMQGEWVETPKQLCWKKSDQCAFLHWERQALITQVMLKQHWLAADCHTVSKRNRDRAHTTEDVFGVSNGHQVLPLCLVNVVECLLLHQKRVSQGAAPQSQTSQEGVSFSGEWTPETQAIKGSLKQKPSCSHPPQRQQPWQQTLCDLLVCPTLKQMSTIHDDENSLFEQKNDFLDDAKMKKSAIIWWSGRHEATTLSQTNDNPAFIIFFKKPEISSEEFKCVQRMSMTSFSKNDEPFQSLVSPLAF